MFEIVYTCHLLHLLGAEIPLTSLDRILAYFYLAYLSELSEGVSGKMVQKVAPLRWGPVTHTHSVTHRGPSCLAIPFAELRFKLDAV